MIFLDVPFKEKDEAKVLGAKWDSSNKKWCIYDDMDSKPFHKWLPRDFIIQPKNEDALLPQSEKGISLTEYLSRVSQVVAQSVATEWIRGEVSSINIKSGHYYLEIVDSSDNGRQTSKCRAVIWQGKAESILNNFKKQTGSDLKTGMKILLKGKADLHILYGLSVQIEDIDPNYTIGNLIANLNALRKRLQEENIYGQNKRLAIPADFTRIAVISPTNAAGLGDFRKEADLLSKYGLCKFTYYEAVFQGKDAGIGISAQITQVISDQQEAQYDALVIIRGGGAVTDLAWLNDYEIAKAVCNSTIPVFSGIGHERDNTIVDEVSCYKFDTPSKVIKHIWNVITTNAIVAKESSNNIFERARIIIERNHDTLGSLFTSCLREVMNKLSAQHKNLSYMFNDIICLAQNGMHRAADRVDHQFKRIIISSQNIIGKLSDGIKNIYHDKIIMAALHWVGEYKGRISNYSASVLERAGYVNWIMSSKLNHLMQLIDLANPTKILQRGFALVRSSSNKVVTSKVAAMQIFNEEQALKVVFSDGDLVVTNIERDGK